MTKGVNSLENSHKTQESTWHPIFHPLRSHLQSPSTGLSIKRTKEKDQSVMS